MQSGSVGSQCVDDVAFLILPECAPVQVTNSRDIIRTLFSNFDQHVTFLGNLTTKLRCETDSRWPLRFSDRSSNVIMDRQDDYEHEHEKATSELGVEC
jgi:hypothetical protein